MLTIFKDIYISHVCGHEEIQALICPMNGKENTIIELEKTLCTECRKVEYDQNS